MIPGCSRMLLVMTRKTEKIDVMMLSILPIITFKRPPAWEHPIANAGIVIATVILILWGLILPPCSLVTFIQRNKTPESTEAGTAARLVLAVAMLNVCFVISLKLAIDPDFIFAGEPLTWLLFIPRVTFIIGLLLP